LKTTVTEPQIVAAVTSDAQLGPHDRAVLTVQALPVPPRPARRGFRLLRYFSVASLIAIVLAAGGLGFFFRQSALKQLIKVGEDNNVSLARAFSNTLRPHYIPLIAAAQKSGTAQVKAHPQVAALHQATLDAVRQTHVVKVRIYDLSGRTIYSSDPRQIGEIDSADPGFVAARAGSVKTVLYQRDSFDAFGQTLSDRSLLATHVPVRVSGAGELDAVFELYTDVTPFFDEIRRTQRDIRFGTATVLILLYGALFFIVKRADGVIKSQERQRRHDEETILHLAHHDTLTGLPNRKLFSDRLSFTLARVKRSGHMAALMFIDLDRFKEINDSLGHAAGDRVLQAAGKLLRGSLRDVDTVARLGGDEFTIILDDVVDVEHVATVAQKIRAAFTAAVTTEDGVEIFISPSIGIALCPVDADSVEALVDAADAAMYDAKAAGRNTYRFYTPDPKTRASA
jgi:diguanylate cyclase (GGDEF)-like protein